MDITSCTICDLKRDSGEITGIIRKEVYTIRKKKNGEVEKVMWIKGPFTSNGKYIIPRITGNYVIRGVYLGDSSSPYKLSENSSYLTASSSGGSYPNYKYNIYGNFMNKYNNSGSTGSLTYQLGSALYISSIAYTFFYQGNNGFNSSSASDYIKISTNTGSYITLYGKSSGSSYNNRVFIETDNYQYLNTTLSNVSYTNNSGTSTDITYTPVTSGGNAIYAYNTTSSSTKDYYMKDAKTWNDITYIIDSPNINEFITSGSSNYSSIIVNCVYKYNTLLIGRTIETLKHEYTILKRNDGSYSKIVLSSTKGTSSDSFSDWAVTETALSTSDVNRLFTYNANISSSSTSGIYFDGRIKDELTNLKAADENGIFIFHLDTRTVRVVLNYPTAGNNSVITNVAVFDIPSDINEGKVYVTLQSNSDNSALSVYNSSCNYVYDWESGLLQTS